MNKTLSWLKVLLGWPLSALALIFIIKIIMDRGAELKIELNEINYLYLSLGVGAFIVYFLFRSFLWQMILKEKGYNIPILDTTYRFAFSEFKRYVPGTIWSFLSRGVLFSQVGVDKKTIGISILTDIQLVVIGCSIVSIFAIPWILTSPDELVNKLWALIPIALAGIFIYFVATGVFYKRRYDKKSTYLHSLFLPSFKLPIKLKLSAVAVVTYFMYGVGNYLSLSSVFEVEKGDFIYLSSFFVFSLLVGYLSFITPMGLGVREAVVTLGLSKIMSPTTAATMSIFTRIVLIFSELLFLFSLIAVNKIAKSKKAVKFLKSYGYEIILSLMSLAYVLYFSTATFLKHDNFYTGRFDLGNMDQTVWNTINGRIFEITDPNGVDIVSRLAFHADVILVLLSPLYLLWDSPKMLLFIQTLVLAFGGIFVYKISEKIIKNKTVSLVFAFAFYITPAVNYTNLFDFHSVTLATTFFLAAFYFMIEKRYALMLSFLLLAGITKEQVWSIIFLIGVYLAFFQNQKKLGLTISCFSILTFYTLIWHAIPNALGDKHFAIQFYSDFGDNPSQIIKNIVSDPIQTINTLFQKEQMDYVRKLFQPLGYLSLLSPLILIFAAPDLAINLLSQSKQMHEIYYQYSATITPFIFISAILAFKKVLHFFPFIDYRALAVAIFFFSIISAYSYGPLPYAKKPQTQMFTEQLRNREIIENRLSEIPEEYSVSASNNLGAHLSHRRKIYTIPNGIGEADYVAIFLKNDEKTKESSRLVSENKSYILVFSDDNFYLFKKLSGL